MSRADWLVVPLAAVAALAAAAVALEFDVTGVWHVSMWFLAFATVDVVGITLADGVFPAGGTASTLVRVAAVALGLLAAHVATRRLSLERVRRAVDS